MTHVIYLVVSWHDGYPYHVHVGMVMMCRVHVGLPMLMVVMIWRVVAGRSHVIVWAWMVLEHVVCLVALYDLHARVPVPVLALVLVPLPPLVSSPLVLVSTPLEPVQISSHPPTYINQHTPHTYHNTHAYSRKAFSQHTHLMMLIHNPPICFP